MTDRVLTEEEVCSIEEDYYGDGPNHKEVLALFASHRLQAARIQELEERIYFLKLGDKEDD